MINPLIDYINDDSLYVISCNHCAKKNTSACNTCSRKRTEPKPKKECHQCSEKPKKCGCEDKKDNCTVKRSVCNSEFFRVLNYFSELVHDWEKDLAKYNLGISELESINYFTDLTELGELLNKVLFVFRRGHEVITKEFLVAPKGDKGDKGEPFEWKDLTNEQKELLRGNTGYSPILKDVHIVYTESPCEVGGRFLNLEGTLYYDLYLTLPKLKTFEDCVRTLQEWVDVNINNKIADLYNKINNIEEFDFDKLGLCLDGNKLSLRYKNLLNTNSVNLNIPELHEYSLKLNTNAQDHWKNYISLLKDGEVIGDTFSPELYKPKDWWILTYPNVILMSNGELITKNLRISAWFNEDGLPAVDMTDYYKDHGTKDYLIYIQTTNSFCYNLETSRYESHWTSLNYNYDEVTGILTLPENFSIQHITEVESSGVNQYDCQYIYRTGDFITIALFSPDSRVKRVMIPVIDIDDYSTYNLENYYANLDPSNISSDITEAIIVYTNSYIYDLRGSNLYNCDGTLINAIIKINPTTFIYKYENGKKYFCGKYEILESYSQNTYTLLVNRFKLTEIRHTGSRLNSEKHFELVFKYLDENTNRLRDLTYNEKAAFYNYWVLNLNTHFLNVIRLKQYSDNVNIHGFKDLTLLDFSTNFNGIRYTYSGIEDIPSSTGSGTGRRPSLSNANNALTLVDYKLHVKSNNNYSIYLDITYTRYGSMFTLSLPATNALLYGNYVEKFNEDIMYLINDSVYVTSEYVQSVTPPSGTTYSNGMFFYDGLFIGNSTLDGTPTISEDGKYAYVITDESVLILNLSNTAINVSFDDHTYTVNPNDNVTERLTPSEPVDPANH